MTKQLVMAIAFLALSGPVQSADDGYQTIYQHLPLSEAANAWYLLKDDYGIPVKVGENGSAIRVPKEKASSAQQLLIRLDRAGRIESPGTVCGPISEPSQAEIEQMFNKRIVSLP